MARRTDTAEAPAQPGHDHGDLADMVTTLTRVFARLAVKTSTCGGAATLRQILVDEQHIATAEEAQRITNWLEAHP